MSLVPKEFFETRNISKYTQHHLFKIIKNIKHIQDKNYVIIII